MKSEFVMGKINHPKEVMNLISHLRRFDTSDVAIQRQKIICFYDEFGEKATKEAFGVDRKLIYIWKKRIKRTNGLDGLVPTSTAPINPRRSVINPKIIKFIKDQREFVPKMSKKKFQKMVPFLDEYCLKEKLPTVSVTTIGRIIKRNNMFFNYQGKVYHNPNGKCAQRNKNKAKLIRTKHPPHPTYLGFIQLDTVEKIIDKQKWYMYQAIDVKGKTALSLTYKHLNSANTVDFIKKFAMVIPYKIKVVQTDNGKEFKKHFIKYLAINNIPHIWVYPKLPKVNGCVERFNRTLTEDFIDPNLDLIHDQVEWNNKLAKYMIYYNCQRIHESLSNMTPINYLIQEGGMSNMYRSHTSICIN